MEALKMLERSSSDKFMRASRGELFSLPNPVSKPDNITDKVDSITVCASAYLLLHEYGHIFLEHDESSTYDEIEADKFAIRQLIGYCMTRSDADVFINTATIGIIFSMIAAAYVNNKLVSSQYPDIDDRIEILLNEINAVTGKDHHVTAFKIIWIAVKSWAIHFGVDHSSLLETSGTSKERLCQFKESLKRYKASFSI